MKIDIEDNAARIFGDLSPGECFVVDHETYMKVAEGNQLNAVHFYAGKLSHFPCHEEVRKVVDVELTGRIE